jgi:hypothetical protein
VEWSIPFTGKKPVVTKVAAFDSLARLGSSEPVVTEVAAFERDLGPHVFGERTTIPADRRLSPAVS